ncbi:hypothetical protein CC1G_09398 [Coprinopsis cinerea okayama7|uniref:Uncharacterized protein n=1 Tax=Coprinopsis cinerea (strain Okayama-7 / 130 / ATCC MYA-4618 / FGSC 9003) TaxID=240176 RepID=A8NB38_COPC7|nr:hypothetical protein CC1G_09398 [Coprinopsis cinerea okayama7\|eukprot:XP_001832040.2 hypothetical protein CC1G_09398 [Coprinopsis cinerea okayama7\
MSVAFTFLDEEVRSGYYGARVRDERYDGSELHFLIKSNWKSLNGEETKRAVLSLKSKTAEERIERIKHLRPYMRAYDPLSEEKDNLQRICLNIKRYLNIFLHYVARVAGDNNFQAADSAIGEEAKEHTQQVLPPSWISDQELMELLDLLARDWGAAETELWILEDRANHMEDLTQFTWIPREDVDKNIREAEDRVRAGRSKVRKAAKAVFECSMRLKDTLDPILSDALELARTDI